MNNLKQIFIVIFISASMLSFYFLKEQNNTDDMVGFSNEIKSSGTQQAEPHSPTDISVSDFADDKKSRDQKDSAVSLNYSQNSDNTKKLPTNLTELNQKIENFFLQIPLKDTISNSNPEDLHGTPEQLKTAAAMLGEMRDIFDSRPWPQNLELEFYLRCSQEEQFFTGVKALCAARVSKIYFQKTGRLISNDIFDARTAELKDQL